MTIDVTQSRSIIESFSMNIWIISNDLNSKKTLYISYLIVDSQSLLMREGHS